MLRGTIEERQLRGRTPDLALTHARFQDDGLAQFIALRRVLGTELRFVLPFSRLYAE